MKKILLLLVVLVSSVTFSQNNGITYQAVIYSTTGESVPGIKNFNSPLANKAICLQFSIVDENTQTEYQEKVTVTTDDFGMVNLIIGNGTQTGGYVSSFNAIVWTNAQKYLKVSLDQSGNCSAFEEISNQVLTYVPFALAANSATTVSGVVSIAHGGTNATTVLGAKTNLQLQNVDNTSDLNKPLSTATQTALNTKVDKVTGKDLSTNDYTTAEKTKLASLGGTPDLSSYATLVNLNTKVDKVTGKDLSTNDYTTDEKSKLGSISGVNTGDQDLSLYATNANLALKAPLASPNFTGIMSLNNRAEFGQNIEREQPSLKLIGFSKSGTGVNSFWPTQPYAGGGLEIGDGGAVRLVIYRKSSNTFNISTTGSLNEGIGINADSYDPAYTLDINGTLGVRNSITSTGTITAGAVTYPNVDGTSGQVLATNGAGVAAWTSPSSSSASNFVDLTSNQTIAGNKTISGITSVSNSTVSTDTSSGALVVTGGTGIGGNLNVGGNGNIIGSLGIGTNSTNSSVVLDINSTTKGVLFPRLTLAQRNLIASPAKGLILLCTDCGSTGSILGEVQMFNGLTWQNISGANASSVGSESLPVLGSSFQGGLVGYILAAGDPGYEAGKIKGLVVTATDVAAAAGIRYDAGTALAGINNSGTAIGTGLANTLASYTAYGSVNRSIPKIAMDYSIIDNGITYDDWYIPSRDELLKIHSNKAVLGSFPSPRGYWSSSLWTNSQAGTIVIFSDTRGYYGGDGTDDGRDRVRLVRSFSVTLETTITANNFNGNATSATNVTGIVAIANGGTGSNTQNFTDLSTNQTIAGSKTFSADLNVSGLTIGGTSNTTILGANASGGPFSTTIGNNASSPSSYSVAIGRNSNAMSSYSLAIGGLAAKASQSYSLAIGGNAPEATGVYSTAIGGSVPKATALQSTALGSSTTASGQNSTALGYGATVSSNNTIQLGNAAITNVNTNGTLSAFGFKTPSGTSSQYLMADGSLSDTSLINDLQSQITQLQSQIASLNFANGFFPKVTISNQVWSSKNLDVTTYRDGSPIPQVTDPTQWANLTTGAWCYANNDSNNNQTYGKLYNWFAIKDPRGIAPAGYHVPTEADFVNLIANTGGSSQSGWALKEIGSTHWFNNYGEGSTNSSGFTAVGSGLRLSDGNFIQFNRLAIYHLSDTFTDSNGNYLPHYRVIRADDGEVFMDWIGLDPRNGFSIRLVKD
jgi:uncharacterized protein (TIGR02145 family)